MEPCLNPAIEAQAIGRVHRLGQQRPVKITRLIMEDSIETRIREMLAKKYGTPADTNANTTSVEDDDDDDDDDEDDDDEDDDEDEQGGGGSSSNNKKKKPAPGPTTIVAAGESAGGSAAVVTGVVNIGSLRTEKTAILQAEFDLLFGVEDEDDHQEEEGDGTAAVPDTMVSLMQASDVEEDEDDQEEKSGAVPDTMLSLMQSSCASAGAGSSSMETETI
jgi:hypothetical protein